MARKTNSAKQPGAAMQILLNEDQTLIQESAQRFGADHGGGDRLRSLRDGGGTGLEPQDLPDAGADGWLGLMAPEAAGGAGLGAKLGAPDRQVITTVGDGSYMFNVPTACHFVARAENLPTLTIINNNSEWYAVRRATTVMYPEGRAAKSNTLPVVNLAPSPNYEKIVESVDGYGEKVEDPAKLPAAMERAMQAVEDGNPAVLNVVTQAGGR